MGLALLVDTERLKGCLAFEEVPAVVAGVGAVVPTLKVGAVPFISASKALVILIPIALF